MAKLSKIYKNIEKAIQGRNRKKIKGKKKIIQKKIELHKQIRELKRRRILDRIEDKIPSTFFRG